MLHIREEGQVMHQGFNFYPLSDVSSFGFVFKFKDRLFWFRYSKNIPKWIIGLQAR